MTTAILLLILAAVEGTFEGSWSGATGSGGSFRLAVVKDASGKPRADVVFGMGASEVKTKVTFLEINDAKIQCKYEFEIQGFKLESTIDGQLSGDDLTGVYKTRSIADNAPVDQGEWKAKKK